MDREKKFLIGKGETEANLLVEMATDRKSVV